jgi:hypothetical protein
VEVHRAEADEVVEVTEAEAVYQEAEANEEEAAEVVVVHHPDSLDRLLRECKCVDTSYAQAQASKENGVHANQAMSSP